MPSPRFPVIMSLDAIVATATAAATGIRAFGPKRDQRAYRNPRRRPEDGHTSRLSAKGKAKLSCYEISDADRDCEPNSCKPRMTGAA